MHESVRCPRCGALFHLPAERLGRNVACPACAGHLTARPLAVERQLHDRERRGPAGAGMARPRLPLAAIIDSVRSLWNVGSIFRSADAFGVARLALCGISGTPPRPEIAKTALGAELSVPWSYHADPLVALALLVAEGYVPVALETSPCAVGLDEFRWPARTCLVLGNEVAGISPPLLEACPYQVRIPMRGVKDSLNVAVAFGIAASRAAAALDAAVAEPPGYAVEA